MSEPENLVYGFHVISHLLQNTPEKVLEIFLLDNREDKRVQAIITEAKTQSISLQRITQKTVEAWGVMDANHQGVFARIQKSTVLTEHDLEAIIENARGVKAIPLILVLDGVQDPHNLGACLRTADAAGVHAVIIPKDRAATLTPLVRKVASGAAEVVPVVQVVNLARCLEQLKELGVWIIGTMGEAKQSLYEVDLKGPVALVLGAEGTGLRQLTEKHCDILMHIPMQGVVESLNVSVATGVCLYEMMRQRISINRI